MRITGGSWRSRSLKAPKGSATRPTSDRVREALFSILASRGFGPSMKRVSADESLDGTPDEPPADATGEIARSSHRFRHVPSQPSGARVLDLYAGTGALAFEALSRGAASATLVEHARDALSVIADNARALDASKRVHIVATTVERAIPKLEGAFDLIFCDPPYNLVTTAPFRSVLEQAGARLRPGGTLVLEHATADAAPEITALTLEVSRRYGDTTLSFFSAACLPSAAPLSTPE